MKQRRIQKPGSRIQKPGTRENGTADGTVVIYGWHAARAALANPRRSIHRILALDKAYARLAEEGASNLPKQPATTAELEHATGASAVHQGLAICCDPLPESGLEDLAEARLLVVLDQITDPHNVGAILRSAAAFGAAGLVMTERNSPAASGVLAKAASGALEHVPLVRVKNLARALDILADMGIVRIGLDSTFAEPLRKFAGTAPAALVLGAEGRGLRRLTREKCDHLARIATTGPIASLNVSNAAAIALYAITHHDIGQSPLGSAA